MTVAEMWRPIVSLSTEDAKDVELKFPDGNIEVGHFSPSQRRWVRKAQEYSVKEGAIEDWRPEQHGEGTIYAPFPEGVFPAHWRPLPRI